MTCKNCGATINSKFCPNCGQKAEIHRITFGHLVHEFFHAMTHTDKGILFLIKDLIRRPGAVIREYLDGKRKKYFNPISFLVITSAAGALISFKSGYYAAMNVQSARGNSEASQFANDNTKILAIFLIVPIYSFLSWLFFWRPRYNFPEHVVLQSYAIGFYYIVQSLIFIPLFLLMPQTALLNNLVLHVVFAIYMGFVYKQLFTNHAVFAFLKSLIMLVIFLVSFWYVVKGYIYLKHVILN